MTAADRSTSPATAGRQSQFLTVVSRDEAEARFHEHLSVVPLGTEQVALADVLDRVLAEDVVAPIDVPGFDRSNVDGFAVRAADTAGAVEESPVLLRLGSEVLAPGTVPSEVVETGMAMTIATGGMLPRGADAVVMVEQTEVIEGEASTQVSVARAVAPGEFVTYAGTDIARTETILRAGQRLTSREIGVLAALGLAEVNVYRQPRVAVISTGNEITPPGEPLPVGHVYDSNAAILSAAITEAGGVPVALGAIPDSVDQLQVAVDEALQCDMVVLSGGTSKGAGDLSYEVVRQFDDPGIVAHGVALKPGKPICLAVTQAKPVVILPGFPTSAVFTFHEFVAPVVRALAGLPAERRTTVAAVLPQRFNSDRGRTEYALVNLVESPAGLTAFPLGKGSGSVTTFSLADGFITIDAQQELVESGSVVEVTLLGRSLRPADLVVIGSHCVGLDWLLGELQRAGITVKVIHAGSTAGVRAIARGACDIAGVHLLDAASGEYNRSFLPSGATLVEGYRRMQSFVHRPDDPRFVGKSLDDALAAALEVSGDEDPCRMINRNAGSGTRIVIDQLLGTQLPNEVRRPAGYAVQAKSHNAVAAAIASGRADWGVAIETIARTYELASIPIAEEHYDLMIAPGRESKPAVRRFVEVIKSDKAQAELSALGFTL